MLKQMTDVVAGPLTSVKNHGCGGWKKTYTPMLKRGKEETICTLASSPQSRERSWSTPFQTHE